MPAFAPPSTRPPIRWRVNAMNAIFAIEPDRKPATLGRRTFLVTAAAAAGLTIGFRWAGPMRRALAAADGAFAPNAFLRVAPDNSVTVIAKHVEMGQGSYTGLATIVAEELDADWAQIR